ncbi:hypothetical protein, partial [Streptomyces sp. NPDC006668]|uniref:hypothetical protein n=1 Tax=Streptomyces sp. NPDC006668 TaxID=3156903 RepID=UPI0033D36D9A
MGPAKGRIGPLIDAILDEYAAAHAGQFPTMRVIWEKLLDEHHVTAAYATVHRYLTKHPHWSPDTLVRQPSTPSGDFLAAAQLPFQSNVFKHYRALLTAVRRDPKRHGLDGSYATMTAFVLGLDAAARGACSPVSRNGLSSDSRVRQLVGIRSGSTADLCRSEGPGLPEHLETC